MTVRVMLLTQWFDPEPTFKGLVFARELVARGFEVEVVTGFPNYPGGKLYPGYRMRMVQREVIDGVNVTRLPLYPSHGQSAVGRVLNYASFAASSLLYGLFGARRPDVIYAYHPPLTVGVSAVLMRLLRRVPVVYDIQDMWPDTLRASGMLSNEKVLAVVGRICSWVYRRVDQVVVLSPGFKRLLVERGVPWEKIDVIYNWCAEDAISAANVPAPTAFPKPDRFRILFAGNMGKAQALDALIEAASLLNDAHANVTLVMLGGGVEGPRLQAEVQQRRLDNVVFLPAVPMDQVGPYLASADALLVHLKRDPLFTITIPSKTQAYMAAGRPVLMAVEGDAATLIEQAECGLVAEWENPQSLASAILALAELDADERRSMGEKGRAYYHEYLSLDAGVERFGEHFKRLGQSRRQAQ